MIRWVEKSKSIGHINTKWSSHGYDHQFDEKHVENWYAQFDKKLEIKTAEYE